MTTVVNIQEIRTRVEQLGWTDLIANVSALLEANQKHDVTGSQFIAYLDALIAAPTSLDDTTIPGCPPAVAAFVTGELARHGFILT